jgi:hypothetical protein
MSVAWQDPQAEYTKAQRELMLGGVENFDPQLPSDSLIRKFRSL